MLFCAVMDKWETSERMGSYGEFSAVHCCGAWEMSERMGPERACSSVQCSTEWEPSERMGY